jgi:hypothetical protein
MRIGCSTLQDITDILIIIKFQQHSLLSIINSLIKIKWTNIIFQSSNTTISGNDSGVFFYQRIPINA